MASTKSTSRKQKTESVCFAVQALPHMPKTWPGYRFRALEHEGLEKDFYIRPERRPPIILDRLPLEIRNDVGKRVLVRKLSPEDLQREGGTVVEVPNEIRCVGDPED